VARQSGFPRRHLARSQRRKKVWGVGPDANAVAISAANVKVLWTNGIVLTSPLEGTLARIRGQAHIQVNTVSAIASGFRGAIGIGVVNEDAFNAGIGALPGPVSDKEWDGWMFHTFFDVRSITATIADGVNASAVHVRIDIDTKAMRKWQFDQVLMGMIETDTEVGTAILRLDADSRALLLLP